MGRGKQMHERRQQPVYRKVPKENWRVHGTDQYGAEFDCEEYTQTDADRVASKINDRGGSVVVVRQVYSHSAAAYRPVKQ